MLRPLAVAIALLLTACSPQDEAAQAQPAEPGPRRVAITLDDAPVVRFYDYPSTWHKGEVIDSIGQALQAYDAPATVFAIGRNVATEEGAELMRRWMDYGAALGNHSMNHPDFGTLTREEGVREIREAQQTLAPFAGRPVRYFRFPFLAEGRTIEQKELWQDVLREEGLTNARVTINTEDWVYNERYTDAEKAEDWAARYEIGQQYLQHLREAVALWDRTAKELTGGRNIAHVLLLHANRINRDYLDDILALLQEEGFHFVTLDEAYRDPIYQETDTWASEDGGSFLDNLVRAQRAE